MTELYSKYAACGYRVTTDSRAISGGEIFFALKGESFDGNDYALKALESGAAYAVVSRTWFDANGAGNGRLIPVEDTYQALRSLAIEHREALDIPVIGLTGTNGKTTTKNLLEAVLSRKFRVCATKGNLNNDIGVPLSVLRMTPDTEIAVIEMGANHPDDIAKLVTISQPTHGLITNVGKAHLLGFGSFEGVKAAKGELYKWLGAHGGVIFLNEDSSDLREMAAQQPCHHFGYGLECQGASVLPGSPEEPFLRISLGQMVIRTSLVGAYNAANVLAAMAVGEYFGVSREEAADAVASFVPSNNRSQMSRTARNTLIIDAYNANPSSMAAALASFKTMEASRKVAMLGDMRELGEDSVQEHCKVVETVAGLGLEAYFVGEEFRKALDATGYRAGGWFSGSAELASWLAANPVSAAVVLVKGSRGIEMEKVIPEL